MANYSTQTEHNMMVNLKMEILMELAITKAKVIIIKETGNKEKCMDKVKVNGIIKIHNLLQNILDSTIKESKKDMVSILILKELYIEPCGSMEK